MKIQNRLIKELEEKENWVMQEVYRDSYCRINLIAAGLGIHQHFHILPQTREYLSPSMEQVLSLSRLWAAEKSGVFYCLEVQEGQFLPSEDVTWIRKDVIPQLVDAGIRYVAYVSKNNLFRHFSQENILDSEQGKCLSLRIFQEPLDARNWLEQLRHQ